MLVPAVGAAGFVAVCVSPTLGTFSVLWFMFKCAHYSISKPTRELLFTAVPPDVKFGVKAFMDTFVYKVWMCDAERSCICMV